MGGDEFQNLQDVHPCISFQTAVVVRSSDPVLLLDLESTSLYLSLFMPDLDIFASGRFNGELFRVIISLDDDSAFERSCFS